MSSLDIEHNSKNEENDKNENEEYNCDDFIIFYLKKICKNFDKFEDFLDSMILLTSYLTKNLIKNNPNEEDSTNKEKEKDKENNKDKEKEKEKNNKNNKSNTIDNNNNLELNYLDITKQLEELKTESSFIS